MSAELERQKRFHRKVTSGCLTCRKRRVKCDETKPRCRRCTKLDWPCEGSGYESSDAVGKAETSEVLQSAVTKDRLQTQSSEIQDSPSKNTILVNSEAHLLPHVLAGGRFDPFNVFCVDSSSRTDQQILDYAVHKQWSHFATISKAEDLTVVKQNVMSYAVHEPVSYYALIYAGACHKHFWHRSSTRTTDHDPELVKLKLQAIRALREAIQRQGDATEDILLGTFMLAACDAGDKARRVPRGKVQRRKPLLYTDDTEFWSALDAERSHLKVFYDLLEQRGGIRAIRPGVIQTAAFLYDVLQSYWQLSKPQIAPLLPLSTALKMRTWSQDETARVLGSTLGSGFGSVYSLLQFCSETTRLRRVLQGFVDVIIDFDQISRCRHQLSKKTELPDKSTVDWIRPMLIHESLAIPETLITSSNKTNEISMLLYEMCRVSCLIICQVWACRAADNRRRMARTQVLKLIPLLGRAKSESDTQKSLANEVPNFYVWLLVLGLMLAYEDLDHSGEDTCMRDMAPFLSDCMIKAKPEAWPTVNSIMSRFIWLWEGCELTGREAWDYGCQMLTQAKTGDPASAR